jgi:hypothetical protein
MGNPVRKISHGVNGKTITNFENYTIVKRANANPFYLSQPQCPNRI